jgi:hypothetical protein
MPEISKKSVRKAVKQPIAWVAGGLLSVTTVAFSFGVEPITAVVVVLTVLYNNAMTLFTASSIMGFTVAPELGIAETPFKIAAIVLGFMVVGQVASQVWGKIAARLGGD